MMEMHDIVVVGGGPAGCKSAVSLSKDFDVHIIEEHPVSGDPVQCTGLLSRKAMELSGVKPDIFNELDGARFFFPNGKVITAVSRTNKALLVDRGDLDRKMAQAAIDAGAKISYSRRYVSHSINDDRVRVETTEGMMESILIIGADGHSSKVAQSLGDNGPKEYVRGIQYDIRHRMEDNDFVNITIGNEVAPGFFAWEIPFGDYTRVGLCSNWDRGLPYDLFKRFLLRKKLDGCEVVSKYSGKIPLGGRRRTYGDHLLLIGDAAGQVKPISGGGLYPAFASSEYLTDTVRKAMDKGDFSAKSLSSYEKGWKKEIGKNLDMSYRLRKIYARMTDDELNLVQEKLDRDKYRKLFENSDVDDPGSIVKNAFKDIPFLFSMLPTAIRAWSRK